MLIVETTIIQNARPSVFQDKLNEGIKELQIKNYDVEVQYSVSAVSGGVIYSALLIARKHKVTI